MYEDICPYLIRYSILLQMIPPSIPTHEGGSYLNVLILFLHNNLPILCLAEEASLIGLCI